LLSELKNKRGISSTILASGGNTLGGTQYGDQNK
jgi:hypothetical protein